MSQQHGTLGAEILSYTLTVRRLQPVVRKSLAVSHNSTKNRDSDGKLFHIFRFLNGAEGVIDEISFWQRALDEGEVQEMMDISLDVEAAGKLAVTWGDLKVTR